MAPASHASSEATSSATPSPPRTPPLFDKIPMIVRILQCSACSSILKDPVAMPCGRAVCKVCLPKMHMRKSISWPRVADRLAGIHCPIWACRKDHAAMDCNQDVVLKKICDLVAGLLEEKLAEAAASGLRTQVTLWDSKKRTKTGSYSRWGGAILAAYALAKSGALDRDASNAMFAPRNTDPDTHASFDAELLDEVKTAIENDGSIKCPICLDPMSDPVTVPFCGHSFCRFCLHPPATPVTQCPVCRCDMKVGNLWSRSACPPNHVLFEIVKLFWPDLPDPDSKRVPVRLHKDCWSDKTTFPGLKTTLMKGKPQDLRLRNGLAKEWDEKKEHVFGAAANGVHKVGTLATTNCIECYGDSWVWTGNSTRIIVNEPVPVDDKPDAYLVADISPIYDIPIAHEEEKEAEETATGRVTMFSTGPVVVTKENFRFLPTAVLADSAADLIRRRAHIGQVDWLRPSRTRGHGFCPFGTTSLPWWFARVAPISEMKRRTLLRTTSVRERLKIM